MLQNIDNSGNLIVPIGYGLTCNYYESYYDLEIIGIIY